MLQGKRVLVGITGGIACYKACELVSRLKKAGAEPDVVMTAHATEFVAPLTLETLSGNPVVTDMFARIKSWEPEHISFAKRADACIVAPATANVIAKLARGIADDMLTTTALALRCPLLIAPAMNTRMLEHPATQENLEILRSRGAVVIEPDSGRLACGDEGKGRMAEPEALFEAVCAALAPADYAGKTVLVTAGGTRERIDGVRYLGNRSSGKMGFALADTFKRRGARVILIAGQTSVPAPTVDKLIRVETTMEMLAAVQENYEACDVIVKAAAPADYRPAVVAEQKIKSAEWTLELVKNPDIAAWLGGVKGARKLVIFCAETQRLAEYATRKLREKNADMAVANDVTAAGAGFEGDTNAVTIYKKSGESVVLPLMSKRALAEKLAEAILTL